MTDLSSMLKLLRFPLDLTGVSKNNYVESEIKTLPTSKNRAVVLSYGPFFSESIKVFDAVNGLLLKKGEQYICAQLNDEATARTGKEVCSVVIITDQSVSREISINYQAVGGVYALSVDALIQMIESIDIDERPVSWAMILGKPDLFPPGHHLHDLGDVYGFEYVVLVLEEIRKAILMGDVASHDEIYRAINAGQDEMLARIKAVRDALTLHVEDSQNPHSVNKEQVGLKDVENYPVASEQEAIEANSTTRYLTPRSIASYMANKLKDLDKRYLLNSGQEQLQIKVENNKAFVNIAGSWKQFFPPQWS